MKLSLPQPLTGYHVFGAFVAFFAVVIAVNMVMVYLALDSWSGLSTDHPYERGLRYNKTLEAMEQRDALGWQESLSFEPLPVGAGAGDGDESKGRITLELRDREGALLEGLIVEGQIRRPTNEGFDRPVTLQAIGAGRYGADVGFPLKGNWLLRLNARRDPNRRDIVVGDDPALEGFVFGIEKRIQVP